jgi:vacuolar-type H+-ATPase subunit C/Vma6
MIPTTNCPLCDNILLARNYIVFCGVCMNQQLSSLYKIIYYDKERSLIRSVRVYTGKWYVTNIIPIKSTVICKTINGSLENEVSFPMIDIDYFNLDKLNKKIDNLLPFI